MHGAGTFGLGKGGLAAHTTDDLPGKSARNERLTERPAQQAYTDDADFVPTHAGKITKPTNRPSGKLQTLAASAKMESVGVLPGAW
jgi:hypothetical protein